MTDSDIPSVLGADGTIDLTGGLARRGAHDRPTSRPSGDAWVADRDRRSLPPPLVAAEAVAPQTANEPAPDDVHREITDHFALGDYAAALHSAELQLGLDPGFVHSQKAVLLEVLLHNPADVWILRGDPLLHARLAER